MLAWRGAVQTAAFGGGLGDLFLLTAGVTALCAVMALMLPAKPVAGAGTMVEGGPMPAPQAAEPEPEPVAAAPPRRRSARRRTPAAPPVAAAVATSETSGS
jgi:hypothetical protein